jgi:O-antigen/teichoic acid export membrane protein
MGELKREISITFIANSVAAVLFLCSAIILARALGPADRGLLSLALLIPLVTSSFCILGQDMVNTTFAGLYKDKRSSLFQQSLIITFLGAALSTLVICGFYFWLPISKGKFEQVSPDIVMLSCLVAPILILSRTTFALVMGVGKIITAAVINVTQITALLILMIIFLVWLNCGLKAALIITALYPLAAICFSVWALRDYVTFKPSDFSGWLFKSSMSFGSLLSLTVLANFLAYRIGHGILGYMVSLEQVGLYAVAVGIAEQLRLLPNAVSSVFLPRLANDIANRQSQVPEVFRYTLIISVISIFLMGILGAPAMVLLFGWEYRGSITPFLLLLPGIAVLGSASILSGDLIARQKPKYSMWVGYVTLVSNIIFSLLLIPLIGIAGAALASSISFTTGGILWVLFYQRESGTQVKEIIPRWKDIIFVFNSVIMMTRQAVVLAMAKFKSIRLTGFRK